MHKVFGAMQGALLISILDGSRSRDLQWHFEMRFGPKTGSPCHEDGKRTVHHLRDQCTLNKMMNGGDELQML